MDEKKLISLTDDIVSAIVDISMNGMNGMPNQKDHRILKNVGAGLGGLAARAIGATVVGKLCQGNDQQPQQPQVNDLMVTLLDGRNVRKSQVPVGVVYINKFGQKVKKVIR